MTALAVGLYSAIGLRFVTGIGLGGALVAGASYLIEYLPSRVRGRYITFTAGSCRSKSGRSTVHLRSVACCRSRRYGLSTAGRLRVARDAVLVASLWVVINLAFYGIFTSLPDTVATAGYTENLYGFLFVVTVLKLTGRLSAAYLIEVLGRKWTLGGFTVLNGAGTFLFAAAIPGAGIDLGASRTVVFLLGLFVMGFALLGAWAVLYAYTSEVCPTEVRSTGSGLSGSIGEVAAAAARCSSGRSRSSVIPSHSHPWRCRFSSPGSRCWSGVRNEGRDATVSSHPKSG